MFYSVSTSPESGIKDPYHLMWNMTVQQFFKYRESIDILESYKIAGNKDQILKTPKQ